LAAIRRKHGIMSSFSVILNSPGVFTERSEIEDKIYKPLVLLTLIGIIINRLLTMGLG
jgi:hypothetical protein